MIQASSAVTSSPVLHCKEKADPKSEAVCLLVLTLTYDHKIWIMTERTRSQIQGTEMSFNSIRRKLPQREIKCHNLNYLSFFKESSKMDMAVGKNDLLSPFQRICEASYCRHVAIVLLSHKDDVCLICSSFHEESFFAQSVLWRFP
ncbi:hypothetical protein ATANTOWER_028522 [Ataeniobius toweri]|uniref:Uncharacterized protein n=1 Tax=Ataeniobius toweri TaxID=208326 RepID=A0ABU7A3L0_9TELE|nr:hypothetical protein [Ataeniobius toweri]